MAVAAFVKGALIEIEGRPYKLSRQTDLNKWQVEDQVSGYYKDYTKDELNHKYIKNDLIFINDSEFHQDKKQAVTIAKRQTVATLNLNAEQLKELKQKVSYVVAVEYLPVSEKLMKPAIQEVWEKLGSTGQRPNWITVARWKKRYLQNSNDAHSLWYRNYRKGNRKLRYPLQVIRIVEDVIEQEYLTRERKSVTDIVDFAIVMVERKNEMLPPEMQLPLPTRKLVQRYINTIDIFDRYAARYGNLAAIKKFRSVLHMNIVDGPMKRAEIDHTQLDLMVIDEETGMPLGRPWVTVCIDWFTRCILGIYVGFEPPSYLTVARCLKQAFLPKLDLGETYPEINNDWMPHGLMSKLVVDNGLEFHGHSLEAVCLALGIDLQFTPRKTPWWKGAVERFIGTMNRGVAHGNPGTTFSNIFEKGDYDPVKNAAITLNLLKLILNKWVVDVYHQKPHRSLDNLPPAVKWSTSVTPEEILIPDNPARLDAILGSVDKRVLTHKGIEFLGLFYNSNELANLRRRKGDVLKVDIRIDEGDLGHIHVIAPDGSDVFRVPCIDFEYANGLTAWQHGVCKRYARIYQNLGNNSNAWRHAKVEISEMVRQEMFGRKKKKTNAKAARFANASAKSSSINITNRPAQLPRGEIIIDVPKPVIDVTVYGGTAVPRKFKAIIKSR